MTDRRFRLLPLFFCLASAGCSWFSDELVLKARLPEPPAHWLQAFPDLRYELLVPQLDGSLRRAPWNDSETLAIPKKPNWPALAVPYVRGGRVRLPPAGAVWPLDAGGQELLFSWERGPLAEALLTLRREGVGVSALNAGRLALAMRERSEGDPWRLDLVHLEKRLASGEFRETDIRTLPARDILLALPAGQWFLESPFGLPQTASESEALSLPGIPYGPHRLFSGDGRVSYALYIREQDVLVGGPD